MWQVAQSTEYRETETEV